MTGQDPWIRAEMGGTKQASIISKPEVLSALMKKANHPIFLIGSESITDNKQSDLLITLIKTLKEKWNVPVISTAHITGTLISRGLVPNASMGSMEIIDRLCDNKWQGLDGKGQYDLVILAGFSYTLGSLLLSGLKQCSWNTKKISLDPKYHPHATWSYGNMKFENWQKEIERFFDIIKTDKKNMEESHV